MPGQATGPQGGGEPLPLSDSEPLPRAVLPQRPMGRRRRNAALGRAVDPGDNAACGGCGSCCDYPVWLYAAQKQEGLYLGYDFAAAPIAAAGAGAANMPPLLFSPFAAEARGPGADSAVSGSALFADWCLGRAAAHEGRDYGRLGRSAAQAESWLQYGAAAQPCLGAIIVAEEGGQYCLAFCVGAINLTAETGRGGVVYLGLGARRQQGAPSCRIGLLAFAAANIIAFRLPPHYRPCKEHFKLDDTLWALQFRALLAQRQAQQFMEQAAAVPAAAPAGIAADSAAAAEPAAAPSAAFNAAAGAGEAAAAGPAIAGAANNADAAIEAALERELAGMDFSAGGGLAAAAPPGQQGPAAAAGIYYPRPPAAELAPRPPLRRYI